MTEIDKKPVECVEESDPGKFEKACAALIDNGYHLSSSSCGFVDSAEYDFCSAYHAVFVLRDVDG